MPSPSALPGRPRSAGRLARGPALTAAFAARLTARDRWLLRMIHEHRVLTTGQITPPITLDVASSMPSATAHSSGARTIALESIAPNNTRAARASAGSARLMRPPGATSARNAPASAPRLSG